MNYPEVRIKDAWLLRQAASAPLHELWAKEGDFLASDEEMTEIIAGYQKAWQPYEKKIMTGLCELTGLEFRQNIIDVNIAPWFRAFSDPMVIGVTYKPDRFLEILAHEMIHRLLTDNLQTSYDTDYVDEWKKIFGNEHEDNVLIHIPVHAILQALFDDVLHEPTRTKNDRKLCKQWRAYDDAWIYVAEHGYKQVIERLKESYQTVEKRQRGA